MSSKDACLIEALPYKSIIICTFHLLISGIFNFQNFCPVSLLHGWHTNILGFVRMDKTRLFEVEVLI